MKLSSQQRDALRRIARGGDVPAPILRSLIRAKLLDPTMTKPTLTDAGHAALEARR